MGQAQAHGRRHRPVLTGASGIRPGTPLAEWYAALLREWGPQGWWPGRTRFEVIVGAILTQGVAWTNVEKAIRALRRERLLSPAALHRAGQARLAGLIRPTGYFNQKARKLLSFAGFLIGEYDGSLDRMFRTPIGTLRARLLALPGIGPETADSILLYAGGKPVFVIDAYTRRILHRHGATDAELPYERLRLAFESALPPSAPLFNEFHALVVRLGKERCRRRAPRCDGCPLEPWLIGGRPAPDPPATRRRRRGPPARRV